MGNEPDQWIDGVPLLVGRRIADNKILVNCRCCGKTHRHGLTDAEDRAGVILRHSHCGVHRGSYVVYFGEREGT